jgi:hypothetical protein
MTKIEKIKGGGWGGFNFKEKMKILSLSYGNN